MCSRKQAGDVRRTRETIESIQAERLTETQIKPKLTEIEIAYFGIAWIPE
jgi:hypothetical protein